MTFLLAVDPEMAYQRIEARGNDHEELAYLSAADAAYRSLPEYADFVVVDANGSPDEVTAALLAHLVPPAGRPAAAGSPRTCRRPAAPAAARRAAGRRSGRRVAAAAGAAQARP